MPGLIGRRRRFSPLRLAGCIFWAEADQITGLVDGDPVTTWFDLSGNGNNPTQSTASKKPTYKTNIVAGKPVVRFATDDELATSVVATFNFVNATLVLVRTNLTNFVPLDVAAAPGGDNESTFYGKAALHGQPLGGSNSQLPHQDSPAGFAVEVGVFGQDDQDLAYYLNGVASNQAIIGTTGDYTAVNRAVSLGNRYQSVSGEFYDGDIATVIIFNRKLSVMEIAWLSQQLGAKYGIAVTP